jgi:long-subunit acyl-CoA synthetase (AMP-forming)
VNSYGMTEASHQMSSTYIDSGPDAIGTVGWAAGPEIAVLGADSTIHPTGTGELVVRGAGLTTGYAGASP